MTHDPSATRDDIELLGHLVDEALDNGADHYVVAAISSILRERRDQLERLELAPRDEYRAA